MDCQCGCGEQVVWSGRGRVKKFVNATHRKRFQRQSVTSVDRASQGFDGQSVTPKQAINQVFGSKSVTSCLNCGEAGLQLFFDGSLKCLYCEDEWENVQNFFDALEYYEGLFVDSNHLTNDF